MNGDLPTYLTCGIEMAACGFLLSNDCAMAPEKLDLCDFGNIFGALSSYYV